MRNRLAAVAVLLWTLTALPPAAAVAKEILQLQRDVALLNEQMRDLNRLMTERLAVVTALVERSTDQTNKLNGTIEALQRNLQSALTAQISTALAAQSAKLDPIPPQLQAVSDSIDELKARQSRLADQMSQMKQLLETINQPPPVTTQPAQPVPAAPPPPQVLYDGALADSNGGKYDLSIKGFQDYLKYYPEGDLASNAHFHIGSAYIAQKKYEEGIDELNIVLDQYPKSNKAPASHLKKGLALTQLKKTVAARREFNALVQRFPRSEEAGMARQYLRDLR